jgi:hypothetical protein
MGGGALFTYLEGLRRVQDLEAEQQREERP